MTRRDLLALLAAAPTARVPRIAAIVTSYYWFSHADVILGRILSGCSPNGAWHAPRCRLVSLFTHQIHERDMSADLAARAGFTIHKTIPEAIHRDIDAVIFIGEHGNYPDNERGQKLYPRFELFSQILDVYEKTRRPLPTFFDKHFSWSWDLAHQLFQRAKQRKVPLLAGSSIPLTVRTPHLVPPLGTGYTDAVALGYGGLDAYGFHTLEALQSIVERRSQSGESGIASVHMITGPSALEHARPMQPLFDAALQTLPHNQPLHAAKDPALFLLQYRDGCKAACLLLNGVIEDWAFAGRLPNGSVHACRFGYPASTRPRPLPHFDGLVHNIEELFLTGRPPYPAERTLLTTGALAKLFESRATGRALDTPELAISYRTPATPYVQTK